jgi:hypothetical protein
VMYRSDDEISDDESLTNTLSLLRLAQNCQFSSALICGKYFMTYYDKNPVRTPFQSGHGWTLEKLNTPGESNKQFRMNGHLFYIWYEIIYSYEFYKITGYFSSCVQPRYVQQCYRRY